MCVRLVDDGWIDVRVCCCWWIIFDGCCKMKVDGVLQGSWLGVSKMMMALILDDGYTY